MGIARRITWGIAGIAAAKLVRSRTRKALHRHNGSPRLPATVQRMRGFGTAVLWAAGAGALQGVADTLRDQQQEVAEHSA
jgi:hypothetical protein